MASGGSSRPPPGLEKGATAPDTSKLSLFNLFDTIQQDSKVSKPSASTNGPRGGNAAGSDAIVGIGPKPGQSTSATTTAHRATKKSKTGKGKVTDSGNVSATSNSATSNGPMLPNNSPFSSGPDPPGPKASVVPPPPSDVPKRFSLLPPGLELPPPGKTFDTNMKKNQGPPPGFGKRPPPGFGTPPGFEKKPPDLSRPDNNSGNKLKDKPLSAEQSQVRGASAATSSSPSKSAVNNRGFPGLAESAARGNSAPVEMPKGAWADSKAGADLSRADSKDWPTMAPGQSARKNKKKNKKGAGTEGGHTKNAWEEKSQKPPPKKAVAGPNAPTGFQEKGAFSGNSTSAQQAVKESNGAKPKVSEAKTAGEVKDSVSSRETAGQKPAIGNNKVGSESAEKGEQTAPKRNQGRNTVGDHRPGDGNAGKRKGKPELGKENKDLGATQRDGKSQLSKDTTPTFGSGGTRSANGSNESRKGHTEGPRDGSSVHQGGRPMHKDSQRSASGSLAAKSANTDREVSNVKGSEGGSNVAIRESSGSTGHSQPEGGRNNKKGATDKLANKNDDHRFNSHDDRRDSRQIDRRENWRDDQRGNWRGDNRENRHGSDRSGVGNRATNQNDTHQDDRYEGSWRQPRPMSGVGSDQQFKSGQSAASHSNGKVPPEGKMVSSGSSRDSAGYNRNRGGPGYSASRDGPGYSAARDGHGNANSRGGPGYSVNRDGPAYGGASSSRENRSDNRPHTDSSNNRASNFREGAAGSNRNKNAPAHGTSKDSTDAAAQGEQSAGMRGKFDDSRKPSMLARSVDDSVAIRSDQPSKLIKEGMTSSSSSPSFTDQHGNNRASSSEYHGKGKQGAHAEPFSKGNHSDSAKSTFNVKQGKDGKPVLDWKNDPGWRRSPDGGFAPRLSTEAEGKGPSGATSSPGKSRSKTPSSKPTGKSTESQRESLIEQLQAGSYECMVCYGIVSDRVAIWSCDNCHHIYHMFCVKKWARSKQDDKPKDGWTCPACQQMNQTIPNQYRCFCGRVRDPEPSRHYVPHTCGEMCGRLRADGCTHPCNILCHPGPCPPCHASVSRACDCGRTRSIVKCNLKEVRCGKVCGNRQDCGNHTCDQVCHSGRCKPCENIIHQTCHCTQSKRDVPCSSPEASDRSYACSLPCSQPLPCGNHTCPRPCHRGPCPPCDMSPQRVSTCPCGQTPLSMLAGGDRNGCSDPVPTCMLACGKVLPCGSGTGPKSVHYCPKLCHTGPCGDCPKKTGVVCRCRAKTVTLPCSESVKYSREEPYVCERKCNKKMSCARHKCSHECCVDTEHECVVVCGRKLPCGLHRCEELCHGGKCPRCYMASFDELACRCGAEVIFPPVPCGASRPECKQMCNRTHACSHEVLHNCHDEENCPPCVILVERLCMGGHEMRYNIPCHLTDISCGNRCGKTLQCGVHTCKRICHKGECGPDGAVCDQRCSKPKDCDHPCNAYCHEGSPCPTTSCRAKVERKCICGRRKETVNCSTISEGFASVTSGLLALRLQENTGTADVSDLMGSAKANQPSVNLSCNKECAFQDRLQKLAIGLEIRNPERQAQLQQNAYTEEFKSSARANMQFLMETEKVFKELVMSSQKSKVPYRQHAFPVMKGIHRRMIHDLAPFYGCETQAFDQKPNVNIVAYAYRTACYMPTVTLSSAARRDVGQVGPMPAPPTASVQAAITSSVTTLTPKGNYSNFDYFND